MTLKGTQTEKNLLTAFAGESQARNRYTYYAKIADTEGYRQIKEAFEETANHEKEHAKRLFKFLEGGDVQITASFPAGIIGTTAENLKAAAMGENHEHEEMYPAFAEVAKQEGFPQISAVFLSIAKAEMYHERRFNAFLKNIETGYVFKKDEKTIWRCMNCGYNHEGTNAPAKCPACDHATKHFEVLCTNWN
ncbi:MAG: rubrerythrin family protein [Alphaproteobacteria bacterium]|nr:rubrerythrin family protein [Alphaproteobacteria bacterium]MBN2780003.1 rubrerythrin family protein [Alphaproteobacteria bacterium]